MNLKQFKYLLIENTKKTFIKSKNAVFNALMDKLVLLSFTFGVGLILLYFCIQWFPHDINMISLYIGSCIASYMVLWRAYYDADIRKFLSGIIAIAWTSYIILMILSPVLFLSYKALLEVFKPSNETKYLFTTILSIFYVIFDYVLAHFNYIISAFFLIYVLKRVSNFLQDLVNQIIRAIEKVNTRNE